MGQHSEPVKAPAEQVIKEIRRATRRQFSAEEKIRIVLSGLRGEDSIAELCRREGIVQNLYYRWSKEFLEAGKKRLAGDTARSATPQEVKDLRREAGALKEVVAELVLENRLLKKTYGPPRPQVVSAIRSEQSASTYPAHRQCRGQDGDPRVPVLISTTASSAIFLIRHPGRRSTVRPSRFHHPQILMTGRPLLPVRPI
jgi:transposase